MADIPESTKTDAIDILTTYVDFIRNEVRADDFERHPYVPHIEQTIEDLRAAPPAMDREAVERVREAAYRQALEDVCNPLGYLQRMADAEGAKLSGMAYAIASDIGTIQRIAKEALSTLSADAIRQGEGLRALSDRATPGPWAWEQCGEKEDVPVVGIAFPGDDPDCKAPYEGEFRDSDANRMTIAFDWQSCDGHSPSANAAFAVAAVNFVRALLATPASHASDGGKA